MDHELVSSVAKLFAESYKPYRFGAFGKPTLRNVERAHAAGRLAYSCNRSETTITAAAIFNVLSADSCHLDFCGRRCVLAAGSLYVRDVSVSSDHIVTSVPTLINQLSALAPDAPFWIEIHEENSALREQLEKRLGFKYVMTKIKSSSDVKGLYLRAPHVVKMPEPRAGELPSFLRLIPDFLTVAELRAILNELRQYESRRIVPWTQHYSHYNRRHSWTSFALRGYCREDPNFIGKPSAMSKGWKAEHLELLTATCRNTIAARFFGATMSVVGRIPGQKERVRFMRLAARKGELSRHADIMRRDGVTQRAIVRLHIPIVTHANVSFESWGLRGEHKRMHFATRGLYYLDNRKPHRVINRSPIERIHLVIDSYSSTELDALMALKTANLSSRRDPNWLRK